MPIPALALPDHGIRVDLYCQRSALIAQAPQDLRVFGGVDELTVVAVIDTTDSRAAGRTAGGVPLWARVQEVTISAPAAALVVVMTHGIRGCYLVPVDMAFPGGYSDYGFGGSFAHGNDDRFAFLTGGTAGAIAVHDRFR